MADPRTCKYCPASIEKCNYSFKKYGSPCCPRCEHPWVD